MSEGYIEVSVQYNALGGVECRDYKWMGGDVVRISELLLLDADPSVIRYDEFPSRPGDSFEFGPFKLRVLERPVGLGITAVRDRGFLTDLHVFWHRFGRLADVAYRRLVVTLAVWGLADYNQAIIPTWRDVHLLRRMERWTKKRKSN